MIKTETYTYCHIGSITVTVLPLEHGITILPQ